MTISISENLLETNAQLRAILDAPCKPGSKEIAFDWNRMSVGYCANCLAGHFLINGLCYVCRNGEIS